MKFVFLPPRRAVEPAIRRGVIAGLGDAAELVLGRSNAIAPLEEGAMIRSGYTDVDVNRAVVGYTSVYAPRQHEELGWRHDSGRQAKYLEKSLLSSSQDVAEVIASALRKVT